MKKVNAKVSKRIVAIVLAAVAACSVMGCSVEKTVTTTETHTDADGNTTTTTTTKRTDENGTTTTTETTEGTNEEEFEDAVAVFENVPITFANEMGWDVAELELRMSSSASGEWSENFLGDDKYLNDGETATGINVTYDEIDNFIDIYVADSTGEGVEFDGVELPTDVDEIVLSFEYDEVTDSYTVQAID